MQQRKVDHGVSHIISDAHAAVDDTSSYLSPGPKVPIRMILENVWCSESPVLLLRCILTLQLRKVDSGVG